jgi:hypothetical protein
VAILLKSLVTLIGMVFLLAVYVAIEVIIAMVAYMYLALNHVDMFGRLIGFSRDVLNLLINQFEQWAPQLANQAYTTLLGELDPKSILLLLIGLFVSALGRVAGWAARRYFLDTREQYA